MALRPSLSAEGCDRERRRFLRRALVAGVGLASGGSLTALARALAEPSGPGELVALLPFQAEPAQPVEQRIHEGLDARLYTDLSKIEPDRLTIPPERFYVRTGAPEGRTRGDEWRVRVEGDVASPLAVTAVEIDRQAIEAGEVLLECAGNHRAMHFGLVASSGWSGVPVAELVARSRPRSEWVLVEGFDEHARGSTNSTLGCSWVFRREELERAGALLATRLDGEPLTADHGAPVRLLVPRWYGCCSVKWVTSLRLVEDDHPATSQMKEFAFRTHQTAEHDLAAEYEPALVERSAVAVRVEKRRVDGSIAYRVVGLDWGGDRTRGELQIRFRPDGPWIPVSDPPPRVDNARWELWSHWWTPEAPGPALLQLRVAEAGSPTRRLDAAHFTRAVLVDEV